MSSSQVSNVTVANGGYSISTITSTGTVTLPLGASGGNYTITASGYGAGGGGGTASITTLTGMGSGYASSTTSMQNRDVTIKRPSGREIRVGETLELLMDMLMVIQPDDKLMDDNPVLRDAYEHHQSLVKRFFNDSGLKDSYESYQILRKLVSQDDTDG